MTISQAFQSLMFCVGVITSVVIVMVLLHTHVIRPGTLAWSKLRALRLAHRDMKREFPLRAQVGVFFLFWWELGFTLVGGYITGGQIGGHTWGEP